MTLEGTNSIAYCQNCGAGWAEPIDLFSHHFATSTGYAAITSPSELASLDVEIINCPKCPIPHLDDAMTEGNDRRYP